MQEVVEEERIDLQHLIQLREVKSVLNKTKDALYMEQETRKLEQLQCRKLIERVSTNHEIMHI